jgi:hypothetical protein
VSDDATTDDETWQPPTTLEPCVLVTDLIELAIAKPKLWRRHATTAYHSMRAADWKTPFIVVATREEKVKGRRLVFVTVAMKPEHAELADALFGEFACSPKRLRQMLKTFGVKQPVPRHAGSFSWMGMRPSDFDEMCLSMLLAGEDIVEDEDDDGDDDIPF